MSDSILTSTKKLVGLTEDYTAFDLDILMHINSVFSTLNQMGIGPAEGFQIEDAEATWSSFLAANPKFNFVKTYVYLKVRLAFDPPQTAHLLEAVKSQIAEHEYRLSVLREEGAWIPTVVPAVIE